MSAREAFGPNLRRARVQAGVSLRTIVEATNVNEALWEGLERNDFSRWPNGISARAFVREYALMIGVDAESTVDDFCRWFPQGDRRAEPELRVSAEIVNHELDWTDQVPPHVAEGDRRGSPSTVAHPKRPEALFSVVARLRRVFQRA
jgi:transcriptional regulator with XRE-family HTH domain